MNEIESKILSLKEMEWTPGIYIKKELKNEILDQLVWLKSEMVVFPWNRISKILWFQVYYYSVLDGALIWCFIKNSNVLIINSMNEIRILSEKLFKTPVYKLTLWTDEKKV